MYNSCNKKTTMLTMRYLKFWQNNHPVYEPLSDNTDQTYSASWAILRYGEWFPERHLFEM